MEEKNKVFLTDTHAHLASQKFTGDLDSVLTRAGENDVFRIVSIACDLEDSRANIRLAERSTEIFASIGVHPLYAHEIEGGIDNSSWTEEILSASSHPEVCAIGEIGLDFYHSPQDGSEESSWRNRQRLAFEKQLQLCLDTGLPAVIHQRNSAGDVMDVLRNFPGVQAVLHCFGGTRADAEAALSLGHFISFTGILTFSNAESVREVARSIPLDRVMVETDCPYLAPVPFRGKRCEPGMVKHTAAQLGQLHDLDLEEISRITSANATRFFRFPV